MTGPKWRGFAVALAIGAAVPVSAGLLAGPAHAQFWEHQQHSKRGRGIIFRSGFSATATGTFGQPAKPAQAVDSSKAPSPRKVETPPTSTVLVIGDLFADWLGYGLEEAFTDTPEIGIVRKIRPDFRSDPLRLAQREPRLVAGRQGHAGERKAERHRRHARSQRPHLDPRPRAARRRNATGRRGG